MITAKERERMEMEQNKAQKNRLDQKQIAGYEILEEKWLADLQANGYLLRHKKTGARVVLIANDDENKVFSVGFRTPPEDSTGVAHIIEHSVLCGSRLFPVKDPFVELVKGSLNTFLNAMTYPDKTVYPVASCNDKDFQNLMNVYLDAVFYPNIYREQNIFRQEGWHYEMENPDDELSINGVVYNEMKGAFSSPDDVLERELMNALYPDTPYGVESGGDPDVIPLLSYEQFLAFHKKYYHPSNSYIYLYGNMDMAEKLNFIDKNYLSAFEALQVDSSIKKQAAFTESRYVEKEYPISEEEEESQSAYLSYTASVADSLDKELYVAFQILDYALCSAPGAPLKQDLIDKGIGQDVYSSYENGIFQPYFSIIAKNTDVSRKEEFLSTIREVLTDLVKNGLDKKAILAGINSYEFRYREADFGSYPKGLIYGLQMMDSWLYDERAPFLHLEENAVFAELRKKAQEGYFEELIRKFLLENTHSATVVLLPVKGLAAKREKQLKEALAKKKASLGREEILKIVNEAAALKIYQESEDAPEDLDKIPMLTRQDMKKEAAGFFNEERKIGDTKVLFHEIFTGGIGYLRLIFKLDAVPARLYPYVGIFKGVLGVLSTKNYSYRDLFNEINLRTGGISAVNNLYTDALDPEKYQTTLEIKGKALYEDLPGMLELMEEILFTTDFTDEKRLKELLAEGKSRIQAQMISAGSQVAASRALSYGSEAGEINEVLSGVSYYRLVAELETHFEEHKQELIGNLKELALILLKPENLLVDFTGTEEGFLLLNDPIRRLKADWPAPEKGPKEKGGFHPAVVRKNEGFMTSGQVQYVCRAGNFRKKGLPFKGTLRFLRVMMGYDYLWNQVRVKGGAYGCMCNFARTGDSYFVSYRDPNLEKTIAVFEKAAEVIENFSADERIMAKYIIGAIGELDMPMGPATKGLLSLNAWMTGLTREMVQKERDELLSADEAQIRELAQYIRAFMEDDFLCVVGNEDRIREKQELFFHIENLV